MHRIYVRVPYAEKDQAKSLGARWDPQRRCWYVVDPASPVLDRWPREILADWPDPLPGEDRMFGGRALFVDLVPSTCWFTNVRSAVDPADWDRLRRYVYARANYRCEICGARGRLEAHERWDYDASRLRQTLKRLICLCAACHTATHFGLAQLRGLEEQAIRHLQQVNHWTAEQAWRHVDEAFAIWRQRSRHVWTLDLGILESACVRLRVPDPAERARLADEKSWSRLERWIPGRDVP